MAENKEIRFKIGFDTGDMERDVRKVEQTVKNLQKQLEQGNKAQGILSSDKMLSQYAKTAFGDFSKDSQNNMKEYYEKLRGFAVNEQITIKQKSSEVEKMAKAEELMNTSQKKRLENLREELQLMKDKHRETIVNLSTVKNALGPDASQEISQKNQGSPGFMEKYGSTISMAGAAITGAAQFARAIDPVIQRYIERDRTILGNRGQISRGVNESTYAQAAEKGSTTFYQARDTVRALQMAQKEMSSQNVKDTTMAGAKLVGGLGAAYAGLQTGAAMGSALGPAGTIIGGAIGGIGGFALGSGNMLGDSRSMNALFDRESYKSMLTKEGFEKMQQNRESLKLQDPNKYLAEQDFLGNYKQYQGIQRRLGLNDENLYGKSGYFQSGLREGFTKEDLGQATEGILGAGGSTQMALNPSIANSLQRDYRITNASQILGRLSGVGMSNDKSEDVTRKMLSEAVSAGLDMSKYGEETRRFLQASAELIYSSGGNTSMASMAASGLVGIDQKSQEATFSATNQLNQQLGEGTGYSGALKMSYFSSKEGQEKFGKIDPKMKMMLANMDPASLSPDNPIISEMARQQGVDVNTLIGDAKEMQSSNYFMTSGSDKSMKNFKSAMSKYKNTEDAMANIQNDPELSKAYSEVSASLFSEKGDLSSVKGGDFRKSFSMASQLSGFSGSGVGQTKDITNLAGQFNLDETAATAQQKSTAVDQLGNIKRVNDNLDGLSKAARSNTEASEALKVQIDALTTAFKNGATDLTKYTEALVNVARQSQGLPPSLGTKK